jgi:hypothetical protein
VGRVPWRPLMTISVEHASGAQAVPAGEPLGREGLAIVALRQRHRQSCGGLCPCTGLLARGTRHVSPPCSLTSAQVRHARTAGDSAKTGWRGTRGWNGDIIQPWGHDRCGAIAVKRLGRHAVYGCVILVTRDTGWAEGEHHFGLHRHHDPPHVVGERCTVSGAELVIAVVQEDRRVGPVVIVPRRGQVCQDDGSARTKSVAMQGWCASAPPHSALSKKARPLGFSEPSPLTYS